MIPVLFKGNETNFNHNGIGLLKDTLSCEVSEVRNGSFDLELVYPITGPYFKDLKNGNIIQAKPNDTDQPHNFRITEIDKTLYDKEVVVYGMSMTNDLGGNMVKSLYLADVTPQVILNEMKDVLHYPTTFNFVSNITTVGTVDWELNNPLNLIVGEEGSLVDIFGGEVKRTNDTLFLYGRRGKDNVTTIRAGKNLDGFKMTESFQGKYTQILPYLKYEEEVPGEIAGDTEGEIAGDTEGETVRQEVTVFGSIVSSPYHGRYPVNAIKPIDFSQNEYVREAKTLEALNAEASLYFSDLYSEIDKPSVNINVDMIQLVDSEQYELYERLEKVELTDTVSVYVPEYDVDILVKITELKYDSLRERTISIVASSSSSGRTSLMDEISGSYKQFTTTLVDDKIQSATAGIVNQILTQKNGSNMYAGRVTPPDNSKPGDIWFKDTGGGDVELHEFDGVNWVRKMYKGFGDDVRQLVDDKIAESNALFTGALDEQAEAVEQANALAQLAKTTATNASLSALAANQDAQQALADKKIKDTRNDNQNPQWYLDNYPQQTVEEFKLSTVIGLTRESTYASLTTNVPWTNATGGKVKQTAKTDTATYERYGHYTSWGPWVKIANSSDLANYTTKTEFQTVKETTSLYERVIGSTEVDVKDKIARIVMTDSSFVTEVAKKTDLNVVSTRVEQTANSYSIKFLNNANDITTQLNLTNSATRIKSSLIHLDGNVTVSGTAWMDGAVIKNLSADKITTGTLNANNVNITNLSVNSVSGITATYLQSVIGTAFIDWMKGKIIQGYNNNMTIDLLSGNIILNSGSNAIKRVKGTHTAFVHFNDVGGSSDGNVGSLYASIGVTSSGDGVNSTSSGRFAGLRTFRAASGTQHNATLDQTELYGDTILFRHGFTSAQGFLIRPTHLDRGYDLNDDILNPIRFFARLLVHLNNNEWNWRDREFLDTLLNEWNAYGLSRYVSFTNNTLNIP